MAETDLPDDRSCPHRGRLILALGVTSLGLTFVSLACGFVGLVPWLLGVIDLKAMRNGRMDRDGRRLTRAGTILGVAAVVLFLVRTAFRILDVAGAI